MKLFGYTPVFWTSLREYSKESLSADAMAGVIVGIVALPLAIAFAIASGVSPEKGIITAVIAGFIISVFGGSKVQIGGPTGAFIVIVYGIIQDYGFDGLMVATIMAGLFLILLGFLKLGTIIKYIPYPIVVGFTAGIALTIFHNSSKRFIWFDGNQYAFRLFGQMGNIRTIVMYHQLVEHCGWVFKHSYYYEHKAFFKENSGFVGSNCFYDFGSLDIAAILWGELYRNHWRPLYY